MAFAKTGDVMKVEKVYCSCGGEIDTNTQKCQKCGETFKEIKAKLQEQPDKK